MTDLPDTKFSIVLPAYNEASSLKLLLPELLELYPTAEILVVNDGSDDETLTVCQSYPVKVISHPYSMGNGAAIKSGARNVSNDIVVFMDADGQHSPGDIKHLVNKLINEKYDLVIGARKPDTHATYLKRIGNKFFNYFASVMTGRKIKDLTSGFRATRASIFRKFIYLLPNGFSYPTTSTMAFLRSGYPVGFVTISARERLKGTTSNIKVMKDGVRFLIIITKIGALFSPMRLFLPISATILLTGIGYYAYTYITNNRFTNMSALLFISSLMIFLIGILSEQVSSLHYRDSSRDS
jgi:glycosyltransferase involved in cell wall biosynthesis